MRAGAKRWLLQPHDAAAIHRLAGELQVSPLLAHLLLNRQVREPAEAQRFLQAPLTSLHEPELLPGVPEAVDLLVAAVQVGKKICIYGDYDVDGVSGTAILLTCLKLLQAQVEFHVPHRLEEGYGLNSATLAQLKERGVQVVVTVDCGIASVAEAEVAKQLGLELIITDHHEPKEDLPRADVLVHPRLPVGHNGQARHYPFGGLCGAGVAFKLAWALCKRHCGSAKVTPALRNFLLDSMALAALGTVADVVPLFDENRIFVRHGLNRMREQPSLGLQALLRIAKLEGKQQLAADDIGYTLAPRLNAAGRLGTARLAVELLTTSSAQRAGVLADFLERQNGQRQLLERRVLQEARGLAELEGDVPALVLSSADWHPGILGIVASRLADQFARPVLMIALDAAKSLGQGSGRSVPGFKLHQALQDCTAELLSHGGHAAAAGFRVAVAALNSFRQRFFTVVREQVGADPVRPTLTIDAEVPLAALTPTLVMSLDQMAPFGSGNPAPVVLADRLQVVGQPKKVGAGERHVSFRVRQEGREMRAIAFNMAERLDELLSAEGKCCLAFRPRINEWQGFRSVEMEVRDFQAGSEANLD
jgi:single-stranded-DNA-specific exonuclease